MATAMEVSMVLRRIEGRGYSDLLVKGKPSEADLRTWQHKRPCRVYRSIWPGLWVVRVPMG